MSENRQIAKKFKGSINISLNYLLYLPRGYRTREKKWPLMLFLHGSGERGSNLELIKKYGPPKLVEKGKDFPFILVSPQCPEDMWWAADILYAFLTDLIDNLKVDKDRIYITGLSMGGFGTWDLALKYPDKFAAVAPICGGGNPLEACKIKDLPIWIFHGAKDNVVPVEKAFEMIEALKNCGGNPLVTIYPDRAHDSWTPAYKDVLLYDWFLQQKRE
jgi:predicted peptidase